RQRARDENGHAIELSLCPSRPSVNEAVSERHEKIGSAAPQDEENDWATGLHRTSPQCYRIGKRRISGKYKSAGAAHLNFLRRKRHTHSRKFKWKAAPES